MDSINLTNVNILKKIQICSENCWEIYQTRPLIVQLYPQRNNCNVIRSRRSCERVVLVV